MSRQTKRLGAVFAKSEAFQKMLDFLAKAPASTLVLSEHFDMSDTAARRYINYAHSIGLAHIHQWYRTGLGPYTLIWAAGPGEDAVKPEPLPNTLKVRKSQAKRKADPERHEQYLRYRRQYQAKRRNDPEYEMHEKAYHQGRHMKNNPRTVEKIDPLLAALMGMGNTKSSTD